jgi:hypothetical protein
MRTTRPIAAALLLALAPITFAPSVHAQGTADDPTTAMARARFKEGVEYYDKGEFEQARVSFLQAYALKKHPAVLLNLAWSCLKSGHPIEADRYFKQFLAEGRDITEKQRADANDGVAQSRAKIGRIEVVAGAGTEVTIDGDRIGNAPLAEPVPVEAGAHTVKFKGSDGSTDTQSITVMGGEKASARFKATLPVPAAVAPAPPPPPVAAPPPEPAPPPPPPPPKPAVEEAPRHIGRAPAPDAASVETGGKGAFAAPKNGVPVVILGVVAVAGYAGAVAALVFKQQAQDKADQVVAQLRAQPGFRTCNPPGVYANACNAYATDTSNVNDDATGGNIALGVGIAATAGALVYWLVADKGDDAHAAASRVITPIVGPHVGGLALSTSF